MKTLERRLADVLRFEAEQLPDEEAAHTLTTVDQTRSSLRRPSLAAPAAVVAVLLVAAPLIWLSAGRDGGQLAPGVTPTTQSDTVETSPPVDLAPSFEGQLGAIIDLLPDGFNLEEASAVFTADGTIEETALRYLNARQLVDSVGLSRVEEQAGYTLVQWAWGGLLDSTGNEQGESGWLVMRSTDTGYEVIAATTDGVDLSQVFVTPNGHLLGDVASNSEEFLGIDVLNLDGTPVDSAPNPDGMPDADSLWGTAASGRSPLGVDVQVSGPVILRVNRVGGTFLSISEVAFGDIDANAAGTTGTTGSNEETLPEPSTDDWTDLPAGLSVAVVEEANGRPRIWVKSAVQEPAPAPSTDIAFLPVPVSESEIAVLIPNPEFFGLPIHSDAENTAGSEATEGELPGRARVHWGFEGSDVDTVTIDWETDPRFGIAIVGARQADIVDLEYLPNQ